MVLNSLIMRMKMKIINFSIIILLILDMSDNHNVTVEGIKLISNALKMHPNITKITSHLILVVGNIFVKF